MKVTLPVWDREFLNLDIVAIELEKGDTATTFRERLSALPAELYYLSLDSSMESSWKEELSAVGAKSYGHRVQFSQTLSRAKTPDNALNAIQAINPESSSKTLYELAIASGIYSRFRLDPQLNIYFECLYRYWLDLAFREPENYFLLAMPDENGFSGLLLGSIRGTTGRIELFAVAEVARQRGIGQALWQQAVTRFLRHEVNSVSVATQQENLGACRFYEKIGFLLESSNAIWHLWRKNDRL